MIWFSPQRRATIQRTTLPHPRAAVGCDRHAWQGRSADLRFGAHGGDRYRRARCSRRFRDQLPPWVARSTACKCLSTCTRRTRASKPRTQRLLQWQQTALNLSADNQKLRDFTEGGAGELGFIRHRPGHRQFGRRLRAHAPHQCRHRGPCGARAGRDHRRGARRAADRSRQPRRPSAADHRPQLAHSGDDRELPCQRGAGRRQFRAAEAHVFDVSRRGENRRPRRHLGRGWAFPAWVCRSAW